MDHTQQLQWGHADDSVEDTPLSASVLTDRFMLQWGHADDSVEDDRSAVRRACTSVELQWGHADDSVEDDAVLQGQRLIEIASMGPRR